MQLKAFAYRLSFDYLIHICNDSHLNPGLNAISSSATGERVTHPSDSRPFEHKSDKLSLRHMDTLPVEVDTHTSPVPCAHILSHNMLKIERVKKKDNQANSFGGQTHQIQIQGLTEKRHMPSSQLQKN